MAGQTVRQGSPEVTFISDLEIVDGSAMDQHFKFVCERGMTMAIFHAMIKDGEVQINTRIVWLLVGNCQIPISKHISLVGQIKKLVNTLVKMYPLSVHRVVVSGVLSRPDREVELEKDVKDMNCGLSQGVQDLKRHQHLGRRVCYEPVQRIFLEPFKYCDLVTSQTATMVQVVQPKDRYFVAGTPKLNLVGLYHLKSFILQKLNILQGVNM